MSSPALQVPPNGDYDRVNELNAFAWTWAVFSTGFVTLRFYTRIRLTRNLWWDDWMILFTLIQALCLTGLWTYSCALGGCRHLYYLQKNPEQERKAARIEYIAQPFAVSSLATGKVAVALLIIRIMGKSTWRRAFLKWAAMAGSVLISSISIILKMTQCRPVQALWDPSLVKSGKAKCWPSYRSTDFSLITASWLAFIDLTLALMPITIVYDLQLNWRKKVGLSCLMGMGIFAFACAVVKTTKLTELNARADITYVTADLWIWTANEINLVIIAACIPTLRPLFILPFRHPEIETYKSGTCSHRREGRTKLSSVSAPIGISDGLTTTAVGPGKGNGSWLALGPEQQRDGIQQTIELDITIYKKPNDLDIESISRQTVQGSVL